MSAVSVVLVVQTCKTKTLQQILLLDTHLSESVKLKAVV